MGKEKAEEPLGGHPCINSLQKKNTTVLWTQNTVSMPNPDRYWAHLACRTWTKVYLTNRKDLAGFPLGASVRRGAGSEVPASGKQGDRDPEKGCNV